MPRVEREILASCLFDLGAGEELMSGKIVAAFYERKTNVTNLKTSSLLSRLLASGNTVGESGVFFRMLPKLPFSTIVDPISERTKNECQCVWGIEREEKRDGH
jgi:hypothetical protein